MSEALADQGSFRDPSGRIFRAGNEIFRTVSEHARDDYEFVKAVGLIDKLVSSNRMVGTEEVDHTVLKSAGVDTYKVLRHGRIPFVSYPYEWSFSLLKQAALLHLDIQLAALSSGVSLSDASAYNVQFEGPDAVFIDALAFRRYREGELWLGHKQFCEQFLNPLLMHALFGIAPNGWYRGNLEGIETDKLARLIPWWRNFSFNILTHVTLQARLQRYAVSAGERAMSKAQGKGLSKNAYIQMLLQLQNWISKLEPKDTNATVWQDYEQTHTYAHDEQQAKSRFVAEFCAKTKPDMMFDFGCNSGEYSEVALASGARRVVGFDFDQGALERAYARAKAKNLNLLPLFLDAANPSPGQGWNGVERKSLSGRDKADALIALAFEHHLTIGRNVPIDQVIDWITSFAPTGIIEFVQKSDPTVQQLLMLREDIFHDYDEDTFARILASKARIVKKQIVASTGRTLYWFDRS